MHLLLSNQTTGRIQFEALPAAGGLVFQLENGATPDKHQIETMAGGVGVIDFNNDGRPDIYFANGASLPSLEKTAPRFSNRLFENLGRGRFRDITVRAGVLGRGYCTGVAVADYDNDGWQDIFVTCRPRNILYRNRGDGTFQDVTAKAGVGLPVSGKEPLWSIAAGWIDYDNDGWLDLFVSNYCNWSPANNVYCGDARAGVRIYCDPRQFKGQPNTLYRNNRDGTFRDVSKEAGIAGAIGFNMGVAFADFNGDGYMDIFVANDTAQNLLFENTGRGTFREVALPAGVALTEDGQAVSGMGADFRDFDNDGAPDLFMTALSSETWPLYRNAGAGRFADITFSSGTGKHSVGMSGWCNGVYDMDNDGLKDLIAVRSHATDNSEIVFHRPYREPNAVFQNLGQTRFRDVSTEAGTEFRRPEAWRGCAFADFDGDGRVDVVATAIGAPARLFRNTSTPRYHWIELRLAGTKSNRDGLGARVKILDSLGRIQYNHATTSVGYASSSDRVVHFGLGAAESVRSIEVRWPSGQAQRLADVAAGRVVAVQEP